MRNFILAPLIAVVYWLWSRTWRLKIHEETEFKAALRNGPVIFAHWHGDELVVLRIGRHYHSAAMTSTSKDGELMTRVLKIFGFGISRGSSTRGGVRALVGMVHLMKQGFNATVAVDGPKGPIYKVKPGILALAKHGASPIVPTGVGKKSALVFEKSWNKTYLPWPFSKVVVSFGRPFMYDEKIEEKEQIEMLELKLLKQKAHAQSLLTIALVTLTLLTSGCVTSSPNNESNSTGGMEDTLTRSIHKFMKPRATEISGTEPAVLQYVLPGGLAQKYGFKVGDKITKINGKEISTSSEFQKKMRAPSSPTMQIEYKNKNGTLNVRNIQFATDTVKFGASTEPQNVELVRNSSSVAFVNHGPFTIYGSVSINKEGSTIFLNLILDSEVRMARTQVNFKVINSENKKVLGTNEETLDALGLSPTLVSRSFNISDVPSSVTVSLALEKQHFTFEFKN